MIEVRSRLAACQDHPAQGQHRSPCGQCFCRDSSLNHCTRGQGRRQAKNCQLNHWKKTHLPKPRKGKAASKKVIRSSRQVQHVHLAVQPQAFRDVQASDAATVAKNLKLPRSTLETWLKNYNLQESESTLKKGSGKGLKKNDAHLKSESGRPLSCPQCLDEELAECVLHQRDLQRPVSINTLKAKAEVIIGSSYPSFKASVGWMQKFMRRYSLTPHTRTSISQKLPADLEVKLEKFLKQVQEQHKAYEYPSDDPEHG